MLELTDGWYSLPAAVDAALQRLVRCEHVTVGTKLFIVGAELGGNTEPCHPFEVCTCLVLVLRVFLAAV